MSYIMLFTFHTLRFPRMAISFDSDSPWYSYQTEMDFRGLHREYHWFHANHPDQLPERCTAEPIWPEMTPPLQSFDDFNGGGHASLCGREENRVIGTRHELLTWINVRKREWLLAKRIQSCWPQAVNLHENQADEDSKINEYYNYNILQYSNAVPSQPFWSATVTTRGFRHLTVLPLGQLNERWKRFLLALFEYRRWLFSLVRCWQQALLCRGMLIDQLNMWDWKVTCSKGLKVEWFLL